MTEPQNAEKPFYTSMLNWYYLTPLLIIPWLLFNGGMLIIDNGVKNDPHLLLYSSIAIPVVLAWDILVVVIMLKKYRLYNNRIELVHSLRFMELLGSKKKVIENKDIARINLTIGFYKKVSGSTLRFTLKNGKSIRFHIMWVNDMIKLQEKYQSLGIEFEVTGDLLKKAMGLK